MKDPVEGSLTNLFTSRFWLKGQNDSKRRFRIKCGMTGRGMTKRGENDNEGGGNDGRNIRWQILWFMSIAKEQRITKKRE